MREATTKHGISAETHLSEYREGTLWGMLTDTVEAFPNKEAFVAVTVDGHEERLTFTDVHTQAQRLSAGLFRLGVRRGDRVLLCMTNLSEWIICYYAVTRIGAILVPANTWMEPPEISYLLSDSGARHAIVLDRFRARNFMDTFRQICPELDASIPGRLYSEALPELRHVVALSRYGDRLGPGVFDYGNLLTSGADASAAKDAQTESDSVAPTDIAMIKYTSGSTGKPKGAILEHGGIVANALLHTARLSMNESDVFFSPMPFFHAGGSIWGISSVVARGATLVFTEAFDAELAAELIDRERCTISFGVLGHEIAEAARRRGRDLSSLRASSHVEPELMPAAFKIEAFGLTECYGPAACTSPDDPPEKSETCGRFLPGYDYRVIDPDSGQDVSAGRTGEALIRGNVMRGYWNKLDLTSKAIDPDNWLHSEDLIRVDTDGYVTYVGRLKLMLKSGGENVSIEEVERCIMQFGDVHDCVVVGIPDDRKGEIPLAYVVPRLNLEAGVGGLEVEALRDWVESQLASFKRPNRYVVVSQLERLANGKPDRIAMAERARQQLS